MQRILTAAVLAPILVGIIEFGSPLMFMVIVGVVTGLAQWEAYGILSVRGARPLKVVGLLAGLAVVWSFFDRAPTYDAIVPVVAVTIVASIIALWTPQDPRGMCETALRTVFPVLWIAVALAHLVAIDLIGRDGRDLLYVLFVCVFSADTAAFYFGRTFGKRRMAPRISPNKSWEGAVAGMIASVLGSIIAHFTWFQRLTIVDAVALGLLLGFAGILGDLAESMLKRAAEVKDSSSLLPGHGGLLDRIDSLLFSSPLIYYYYHYLIA